ncbi:S8 family serine peptidase [Akkermansiaceae bacterium]|nr:S8 family serine peptidase [Akkermansiaceae bacterium]
MNYIWLFLCLACVFMMAYLATRYALSGEPATDVRTTSGKAAPKPYPHQDHLPKTKGSERKNGGGFDGAAFAEGAIPNQRIIVFKDRGAMEGFLANMGAGLNVLGRMDKLNALLIGFGSEADLLANLDGTEETSYNFPASIPEFGGAGVQGDAVALRQGLLQWLGVTGDNSAWGTGVKIAILDTGIADHIAFRNAIERINLVALPSDPSTLNGHGTSVASLIFSNNPLTPGIAPGATPLSVRIADDAGASSSFLIAQGIIAAVDAGAQLINISLGGSGQSALVENALAYARQSGVVVVAAAGNNGTAGVMQPAASPNVIAVGAVDARNQHLDFSNTGKEIAVSAPGYAVNAAYPGDQAAVVTGTSFSSPIIAGTIAATMSNGSRQLLSPTQAVAAMNSNLNDIGAQGSDPATGAGVPDMWRILNGNTPGIYDAAITSITNTGSQIQVLVQNLGTETMVNAGVSVNVNGSITNANITTLLPGDTRVIAVPAGGSESLNIRSSVQLSGGQTDQRPANDSIYQTVPAP